MIIEKQQHSLFLSKGTMEMVSYVANLILVNFIQVFISYQILAFYTTSGLKREELQIKHFQQNIGLDMKKAYKIVTARSKLQCAAFCSQDLSCSAVRLEKTSARTYLCSYLNMSMSHVTPQTGINYGLQFHSTGKLFYLTTNMTEQLK